MSSTLSSRAAVERAQWHALTALLGRVLPDNAFYGSKLAAGGVSTPFADRPDFLARFPFTLKSELVRDQEAAPPYGTNLTFPLEAYCRFHQTSGTSGQPMPWLDDAASWQWMVDSWKQVLMASGTGAADRVFFAFSFGPFIGFWLAFEAAAQMGCLCLPGGGLSTAARARLIVRHRVTVLCCTPTYAIRLAEVAGQEGIDLARGAVRTLLVAGEPGAGIPATRRRIEELWPGARVFDHHGMTEVGPVTYECPARPGRLHVIESAYLAEILDPATDHPVEPGQRGELILSTLGRTGSPLIRYRTGDLVQAGANGMCECGRFEMRLEGGILGRTDDMVVVRGVNVYPSAVEAVVRDFPEVAEFRVQVTTVQAMAELAIEVEPDPSVADPEGLAVRLGKAFTDRLALRVPVQVVAPGTLPRFELKARRWVRE